MNERHYNIKSFSCEKKAILPSIFLLEVVTSLVNFFAPAANVEISNCGRERERQRKKLQQRKKEREANYQETWDR